MASGAMTCKRDMEDLFSLKGTGTRDSGKTVKQMDLGFIHKRMEINMWENGKRISSMEKE